MNQRHALLRSAPNTGSRHLHPAASGLTLSRVGLQQGRNCESRPLAFTAATRPKRGLNHCFRSDSATSPSLERWVWGHPPWGLVGFFAGLWDWGVQPPDEGVPHGGGRLPPARQGVPGALRFRHAPPVLRRGLDLAASRLCDAPRVRSVSRVTLSSCSAGAAARS
eukprot:5461523-Pyramimonas_sp.AAC.2